MRVFITGATGYIGHQLALAAAGRGYAVSALVRSLQSPLLPQHPSIQFFKGDVTEPVSVKAAMAGCDAVFHAAALTQFWHRNRSLFTQINVDGTRNVLEAALQQGVQKFVFTSSCAVLGPSGKMPVTEADTRLTPFENDYEISKARAEDLVKEYTARGLHAVIVLPPRVYGLGLAKKGNPIGKLIRDTIKRRIAFMPAVKEVVGNYAFIDDVVAGHFLALERGRSGEKYILEERIFRISNCSVPSLLPAVKGSS
jgi:nucleoside-diphosphate-sugar epimerase